MLRWILVALGCCLSFVAHADQDEPRILILGDSITYGGNWVVSVESAIRAQRGLSRIPIANLALPSETASGLSEPGHAGGSFSRPDLHERLGRVLSQYKPTLVLACYGINDGLYLPLDSARTQAFRNGIIKLRQACIQAGAKVIIITPPLYAPDRPKDFINYDGVLDTYAQWLVDQRAASWQVIDIRPHLRAAIAGAKKEAPKFIYAKDGIHPGPEGHTFIAQAVWSQLAPMMKWKLDTPFADGPKFKLLQQSMTVLRDAWLKQTGHLRPGLPSGLPLEQAEARSNAYLREYFK